MSGWPLLGALATLEELVAVSFPLSFEQARASTRSSTLARRRAWLLVGAAALLALVFDGVPFVLGASVAIRLGAALASVAALSVLVGFALSLRARERGLLTVDDRGVSRADPGGASRRILSFDEPFGVAVMLGESGTAAWLGLSTGDRTSLLKVGLSTKKHGVAAGGTLSIVSRAICTVPDSFDGAAPLLDEASAARFLALLEERSTTAFGRLLLTGTAGERIVLDGDTLHVQDARIRLDGPFECTTFAFYERIGRVDGIYEATWIKQGSQEVVLVSSVGGEGGSPIKSPPPVALRHAVDRAFFPPLRSVLDARQTPRAATRPS